MRLRCLPYPFIATLVLAAGTGCTAPSQKGDDRRTIGTQGGGAAAPTPAADAPPAPGTTSVALTAKYNTPPVDVIIIGDGVYGNPDIRSRIGAAFASLGPHLWNLATTAGSLHVAFVDHQAPPADSSAPGVAPLVGKLNTDTPVLAGDAMKAVDFEKAFLERAALMGSSRNPPAPVSVLSAALASANSGTLATVLRPEAHWSILLLNGSTSTNDPTTVQSLDAPLKAHGTAWTIAAIGVDQAGCTVAGTIPPVTITGATPNATGSAAATPAASFPDPTLALAAAEGGLTASYCNDKSYLGFIDTFLTEGTGTAYFPVTLPGPIKSISRILANKVEVKEYRYVPGSTTLEVTTRIKSGDSFTVEAFLDPQGSVKPGAAPVVSTDQTDKKVPTAQPISLSPEELDFVQNVQQPLQTACGGCHGGRPFDTDGGYPAAEAYKKDIARRIQLAVTDPEYMPKNNGTISAADKQAILGWATK